MTLSYGTMGLCHECDLGTDARYETNDGRWLCAECYWEEDGRYIGDPDIEGEP
jgi:hypothetical protein